MNAEELAALVRRAERFLDEIERHGGGVDAEQRECLAELLVHLGAGRSEEAADAMRRLEMRLGSTLLMQGGPAPAGMSIVAEYRALLKLVFKGD